MNENKFSLSLSPGQAEGRRLRLHYLRRADFPFLKWQRPLPCPPRAGPLESARARGWSSPRSSLTLPGASLAIPGVCLPAHALTRPSPSCVWNSSAESLRLARVKKLLGTLRGHPKASSNPSFAKRGPPRGRPGPQRPRSRKTGVGDTVPTSSAAAEGRAPGSPAPSARPGGGAARGAPPPPTPAAPSEPRPRAQTGRPTLT